RVLRARPAAARGERRPLAGPADTGLTDPPGTLDHVRKRAAVALAIAVLVMSLRHADTAVAATCASSVGPGIPPPAAVAAGIDGFHAAWYGQSGYMSLCPGAQSTASRAYYNTGSRGWVAGASGQTAYLGTWDPSPGQDQPSALGGDGTNGSPATGWAPYNPVRAP